MRPAKVAAGDVSAGLVDAFRRHGYAGASLRTLKDATGLNPASLYHRFPDGKADMACAAIEYATVQFDALVIDPLRAEGPTEDRLRSSANGVTEFYQSGRLACLLATLALSDAPTAVRERIAAAFVMWRDTLSDVLASAGVSQAGDIAASRIASVQGALILAQSGMGTVCFDHAVAQLAAS
ncbi:MAG: TetR/AcrR family transcriptional regulator [Sphingomonadaceae bacterium]|nr:TetR/AcrR family transcriptional regulator [Sphingomonadaceae bacterium]